MRVPWLSKQTIALAAEGLIDHYQMKLARPVAPPIPVEDIIERGLGLRLNFTDLRTRLKMPDVLGATYVDKELICVDESLDRHPARGRLYFTCAHEIGHWVMHRKMITAAGRSGSESIRIFCRLQDARKPLEWQADYFAGNLLMPANWVRSVFSRLFGANPLVLYNAKSMFCGPICYDPSAQTWPLIATEVITAGGFSNVSKQAMIIRLQDLGLVRNETRVHLNWEASHNLS